MTLKPQGNLVVIRPERHNAKTASGLHIPERYKDAVQIWRVLHVGPGKRKRNRKGRVVGPILPPECKPGERVLTAEIPNTRHVFSDGVTILDANEILAVIEG